MVTQMVNFPTWIPAWNSHGPVLFHLFISANPSICATVAVPPLGNCNHIVFSVSVDFPSNSKTDILFHGTASDYSRADWDGLCDYLSRSRLKLMYISDMIPWVNKIDGNSKRSELNESSRSEGCSDPQQGS